MRKFCFRPSGKTVKFMLERFSPEETLGPTSPQVSDGLSLADVGRLPPPYACLHGFLTLYPLI